MHKGFSWLASSAALVAATLAPLAQATIIDFNDPSLTGLYFPGDTFSQSGFLMTQGFDAGTVDVASALGAAAPTGNATQFYTNINDGDLTVTSLNGLPFSLNGFSAAFVPLIGSHAAPQVIGIVALATTMNNVVFGTFFGLGDTSSTTTGSPFLSFSGAANFGAFTNLKSVDFFTCANVGGALCTVPTLNNGQFALDNINVTQAVPEPETAALMALGLMVLTAVSRRRRSR